MPATILVVDDDEPMVQCVATILAAHDLTPVTVTDTDEAARLIESHKRFDLSVVDVVMPKGGGERIARVLRRHDPDAKILYITGYAEALFQARPILWAGEAFLEKPFTPDGLMEAVSLMLYGRTKMQ